MEQELRFSPEWLRRRMGFPAEAGQSPRRRLSPEEVQWANSFYQALQTLDTKALRALATLHQNQNWDQMMNVDPLSDEAGILLAKAQGVSDFLAWIDNSADRADEILTILTDTPITMDGQTGQPEQSDPEPE